MKHPLSPRHQLVPATNWVVYFIILLVLLGSRGSFFREANAFVPVVNVSGRDCLGEGEKISGRTLGTLQHQPDRIPTRFFALSQHAQRPRGSFSSSSSRQQQRRKRPRMSKSPEEVERELVRALDALQRTWSASLSRRRQKKKNKAPNKTSNHRDQDEADKDTDSLHMLLFPTTRECNAALAAFGDAGELLRALKLFGKMRKAVLLQQRLLERDNTSSGSSISTPPQQTAVIRWPVPSPTLVTYSTLMSRAVKLSKPQVALRLWNLMAASSSSSASTTSITNPNDNNLMRLIDCKAANIRMNCFAKLGDVDRALDLLEQMKTGRGPDVLLPVKPNLVTYNTLIDACMRAGDLDAALEAAADMKQQPAVGPGGRTSSTKIRPDTRTYTSLIATVARRTSKAAGRNDPTLAFGLLREMQQAGIRPNGMTYSALIDVCGRCQRSDLALQGLRIMLQQKAAEQRELENSAMEESATVVSSSVSNGHVLPNEVGAWTAAINACGKAGRFDAAMQLFHSMQRFGVVPNKVTCGSLTDSLLRGGRTAETLQVLRYMKKNGIQPSEVMYTSLMTRAERLVQMENKQRYSSTNTSSRRDWQDKEQGSSESGNTKAIQVYTELMTSLMDGRQFRQQPQRTTNSAKNRQWGGADETVSLSNDRSGKQTQGHVSFPPTSKDYNTLLMKVFLVFQEMKAAGCQPDLACFNSMMRACSRAGDWEHAQNILEQMQSANMVPNDTSWRQLIQTAAEMKRSDLALAAWKQGLVYHQQNRRRRPVRMVDEPQTGRWKPSSASVSAFVTAYLREAAELASNSDTTSGGRNENQLRQKELYQSIVNFYENLLTRDEEMGLDRIDLNALLDSQRTMVLILQGIVGLHDLMDDDDIDEKRKLRASAVSILELECCQDFKSARLRWQTKEALRIAGSWVGNFEFA